MKRIIFFGLLLSVLIFASCVPSSKKQESATVNTNYTVQEANSLSTALTGAYSISGELLTHDFSNINQNHDIEINQTPEIILVSAEPPPSAYFALVSGGAFEMGSNDGDRDEKPVRRVSLSPFYIAKHTVSQKEYFEIMGNNPGSFKGDALPVEKVSWFDAIEYCNRLSTKEGLEPAYHNEGEEIICNFIASGYRLPSEAEWECAARGGRPHYLYAGGDNVESVGWYNANSGGTTNEAGLKTANNFGLYDMSGNVWEWCWDRYGPYTKEENNPTGVLTGDLRTARGGSWGSSEWSLRVSARGNYTPATRNSSIGFRIVRSAVQTGR